MLTGQNVLKYPNYEKVRAYLYYGNNCSAFR